MYMHDQEDLDGLFKFIGKIGKGVVKGAKSIFKGGKSVGQLQQNLQLYQQGIIPPGPGLPPAIPPGTYYPGSPNAPSIPGYGAAVPQNFALPPSAEKKGLPDWAIPAAIGGVGLVLVLTMGRK